MDEEPNEELNKGPVNKKGEIKNNLNNPENTEAEAKKSMEKIDKESLKKLSVIMKNSDKLPPAEKEKFSQTLESLKKEVGEVFTDLIKDKDTPISKRKLEKLDSKEVREQADDVMNDINKNPNFLSQLHFLTKPNNLKRLPEEQKQKIQGVFRETQKEINEIYPLIEQNLKGNSTSKIKGAVKTERADDVNKVETKS
ncbi:MAG: hypothetical protein LBI53_06310 [Candidatus Peribacteria bacterium]|jgi:NTP pyrophosphatase (non-canonical NTP hydrolase)|nr:hypothetical protein [Candidatus Peribacteria bacterium]